MKLVFSSFLQYRGEILLKILLKRRLSYYNAIQARHDGGVYITEDGVHLHGKDKSALDGQLSYFSRITLLAPRSLYISALPPLFER